MGGVGGSGAYPYINEDGASKLFEEIRDEDDPNVSGMEGEFYFIRLLLIILNCTVSVSNNNLLAVYLLSTILCIRNLQTMRTTQPRPPRGCPCPRPPLQTGCEQKTCRNKQGGMDDGV